MINNFRNLWKTRNLVPYSMKIEIYFLSILSAVFSVSAYFIIPFIYFYSFNLPGHFNAIPLRSLPVRIPNRYGWFVTSCYLLSDWILVRPMPGLSEEWILPKCNQMVTVISGVLYIFCVCHWHCISHLLFAFWSYDWVLDHVNCEKGLVPLVLKSFNTYNYYD